MTSGRLTARDWLPIETAPLDGSWIWGFVGWKLKAKNGHRSVLRPHQIMIRWVQAPRHTKAVTPGIRALELQERHGGYWTCQANGCAPLHGEPSHWMPPAPSPNDPWEMARGCAPDATGDLSSEEFIRRQRDDWPDRQDVHTSDCAIYNAPAYAPGPCDCQPQAKGNR